MRFLPRFRLTFLLLCLFALLGDRCVHAQAGLFPNPAVIPTVNGWPAAIYTADINNDGFPDLIYIEHGAEPNQPSTTHILLNDGTGHFTQSAFLATTGNALAIGNLLGHGHLDIAWLAATTAPTPYQGLLSVAPGQNNGTFAATMLYQVVEPNITSPPAFAYLTVGSFQTYPLIAGAQQLLAEDTANNQLLFLQLQAGAPIGNVGIPSSLTRALPAGTGPIIVADLNGDSVDDFVINSRTASSAQIFLFGPPGPFGNPLQPATTFAGTGPIHSLLLRDLNNDGRPDLIAEGTNGRIDVFPGNGDGTFQTTSIGGTGSLDGLSGNGGHLIALNTLPAGQLQALTATPIGISSLLGQNSAHLGLQGIYNAGPGRTSYAVADFNHDGTPDLAVDSPEGIALLFGNPDGSFQTSHAFAAGQPALSSALATFTSSGNLDVAVSTAATQAQVLLGDGRGAFNAVAAPTTTQSNIQTGLPNLWSSVLAADFNHDGTPDLLLTADGANRNLPASSTGAYLQFGKGDGTFTDPFAIPVANQFAQPRPSDCNPPFDHFPGLLFGTSALGQFTPDALPNITNRDSGAYRLFHSNSATIPNPFELPTLFWSGGDGGFNSSDCNLNAHNLTATGDLNHDGRSDVVFQSNGSLLVYLTDPTGTPQPQGDLALDGSQAGSLTTPGQLTAPDLSPTFGGRSIALAGNYAIGSMVLADLDGDGNQDLLVLYHNLAADPGAPSSATPNYLYVWYGSGNGKFLTSAAHPQNPVRVVPSRNFFQLAVAPVDGSSHNSILMSDGYLLSVGPLGSETHYLAGQGINSISPGDPRKLGLPGRQDLILANGGLTLSNPVANHETLTPNPDVNTGGITVLLNQAPKLTTLLPATLSASPEPSLLGAAFTISFSVDAGANATPPTGNVSFFVDGAAVATAPLAATSTTARTATIDGPTTLTVGTHSLFATYSGDANYLNDAVLGSHTVINAANTLTGQVIAAPEPSFPGNPYNITVTLTPSSATAPGPTGNLQCYVGNPAVTGVISVSPNAGNAFTFTFPDPTLYLPGTYPISCGYSGDTNYSRATYTANHTVARYPTTVVITPTTPPTVYYGQFVGAPFTVNILNAGYPATGTYTLFDNGSPTTLCTALSIALECTYGDPAFLNAGTHVLTVSYLGDTYNAPSSSAPVTFTVLPDITAAAFTSAPNPSTFGQGVLFSTVITGNILNPNSGPIQIFEGTTLLASNALDTNGGAGNTIATLSVGTHLITVVYPGAPNFLPVTSSPVTQVVLPAVTPPPPPAPPTGPTTFSLSVTPNPVTIGVGRTANFVVAVTSGFVEPVTLTCSGLPQETACNFFLPTIPTGGGSTGLQLFTAAPHDCGDPDHPYFLGGLTPFHPATPRTRLATSPLALAALALFHLSGARRKRLTRFFAFTLFTALTLTLAALSGCGHCTDLGTRPGSYTFIVTGTAPGQQATATIHITVTIP